MKTTTIQDLIKRQGDCILPTKWGPFTLVVYQELTSLAEHVALHRGQLKAEMPILLRIHSECLTGDTFFSQKCDCGLQLKKSFQLIAKEDRGVIIYLRQEGRGIGLTNKIKAYRLQEEGLDTVEANLALQFPADARSFNVVHDILRDLGIKRVRLMTNNPDKVQALNEGGIEVVERIPLITRTNRYNKSYIQTKKKKLNHLF
ncbi:MAG: GTP cyclohydrolase II [Neisseriaceae bacterium]